VLLGAFQERRHYTALTRARFERLAETNTFTAAFAAGLSGRSNDVGMVNLADGDPLMNEWDVIVVGPHFAGALIARDCGDRGLEDMDRRFDYSITHDRSLVLSAARSLLRRTTIQR
jgi:DICT domain-containing protein